MEHEGSLMCDKGLPAHFFLEKKGTDYVECVIILLKG